jgi:hypothetical protein
MVLDLGTGASPPLRISGRSTPGARMVRDGTERRLLRSKPRSLLPGGTPSGRRDPRVCLGVGNATQDAYSRRSAEERRRFEVEGC